MNGATVRLDSVDARCLHERWQWRSTEARKWAEGLTVTIHHASRVLEKRAAA